MMCLTPSLSSAWSSPVSTPTNTQVTGNSVTLNQMFLDSHCHLCQGKKKSSHGHAASTNIQSEVGSSFSISSVLLCLQ